LSTLLGIIGSDLTCLVDGISCQTVPSEI